MYSLIPFLNSAKIKKKKKNQYKSTIDFSLFQDENWHCTKSSALEDAL